MPKEFKSDLSLLHSLTDSVMQQIQSVRVSAPEIKWAKVTSNIEKSFDVQFFKTGVVLGMEAVDAGLKEVHHQEPFKQLLYLIDMMFINHLDKCLNYKALELVRTMKPDWFAVRSFTYYNNNPRISLQLAVNKTTLLSLSFTFSKKVVPAEQAVVASTLLININHHESH